jgi:hypothetical protein
MEYRIVKVETPQITKNYEAKIDFIPEVYFVTRYEIEKKIFFFMPWINTNYQFITLEEATSYVDWFKRKKLEQLSNNV